MIGDELELRPVTPQDFAMIHALADRYWLRVNGFPTHLTPAELASVTTAPGTDPRTDFPVVLLDGAPVAFGTVQARPPFTEIALGYVIDVDLDPATADAVAARLLDEFDVVVATKATALEPDPVRHAAVVAHEREPHMRAIAEGRGYTFARQVLLMSIDQSVTPTSPPVWPDGIDVRPVSLDDAAVLGELSRDTFADHPGDNDFTDEEMAHHLAESDVRLDISLIAFDSVGPVGMVICFASGGGGYVGVVGVRERMRGRGLGTALLRHAFQAFAADGLPIVRLHVEQDNTTGALGVSEAAGMRREHALQIWTRPA
jgi:ribosomal protein S18 acetylase RimI-like enzyme